jgi:hypothetical protein
VAAFARKIQRLVAVRTATGKLRPARITAVGAGTLVDAVVKGGATHAALPKWSRATPGVAGWIRS